MAVRVAAVAAEALAEALCKYCGTKCLRVRKVPLTRWTSIVYNMSIMIEKVSTAALKQQLCHYLGLARQGKEVLITNHKRIIARLLGEEGDMRLPLREPTIPVAALKDVGSIGFKGDPLADICKERSGR